VDVLPQGRHFLQVVHHSFMFCGGRCAIIGGLKYNGSCAGVTLLAHQLGAALRFSGQFPYKANGHGRAMLAPTRVFRQSAPRVPIWEPSAFFISCFLMPGQQYHAPYCNAQITTTVSAHRSAYSNQAVWRYARSCRCSLPVARPQQRHLPSWQ